MSVEEWVNEAAKCFASQRDRRQLTALASGCNAGYVRRTQAIQNVPAKVGAFKQV
jgi:hypothetical protein